MQCVLSIIQFSAADLLSVYVLYTHNVCFNGLFHLYSYGGGGGGGGDVQLQDFNWL